MARGRPLLRPPRPAEVRRTRFLPPNDAVYIRDWHRRGDATAQHRMGPRNHHGGAQATPGRGKLLVPSAGQLQTPLKNHEYHTNVQHPESAKTTVSALPAASLRIGNSTSRNSPYYNPLDSITTIYEESSSAPP